MGNQSNQNLILMYVSTDVYRSGRPRPTATNSPLQFGWFRLKTEVSSVLFESKLENV